MNPIVVVSALIWVVVIIIAIKAFLERGKPPSEYKNMPSPHRNSSEVVGEVVNAHGKAKKRYTAPNVPVSIADNLVVTTVIEKRLRKKAEKEIPRPRAVITAYNIERCFWALLVLSAYSGLPFYSWLTLSLYVGIPILVHLVIKGILAKPLRERQEQVDLRLRELAEERKKKIEEEQLFYSSPEWAKQRHLVIEEEGRVCAHCHRHIKNDSDVTVDHIRPRSKYPDLALRRDNLRVLCRRCNSIKKDKELADF